MKTFCFKSLEEVKVEELLSLVRKVKAPMELLFPKGTSS